MASTLENSTRDGVKGKVFGIGLQKDGSRELEEGRDVVIWILQSHKISGN